jgi:ubiquinone/menaquinone biosynthesis C-methylase UbiE
MSNREIEEAKGFWDRVAEEWRIQVGTEGDTNRILNSDPVLWLFVGSVTGLTVLDAGCGTGYLSEHLRHRGAIVTGVDFSEQMIAIARRDYPDIDFRVDSCNRLETVPGESIDIVIANYVLMDTPDLPGAMRAFHRVLREGGLCVVVFSHPCFPQGKASISPDADEITYQWSFPYFEEERRTDPPFGHFTSDFIWFHRPLSDYWKAFKAAGFEVIDFEEPRVTEDRYHLAPSPRKLRNCKLRPYSVAFKLCKPPR